MTISCRFVYRFRNQDGSNTKEVVVNNVQSSFDAYQIARQEMLDRTNLDIRSFERKWQVQDSEIAIGVPDFPKENKLLSEVRTVNGVESATKMNQSREDGHDVFYVELSDIVHEDYVVDKIKTLVRQMRIDQKIQGTEILIIFNPDYYS